MVSCVWWFVCGLGLTDTNNGPHHHHQQQRRPQVVKGRIGALIDREYLERDPDNTNQYRYLA